MKGKSVRLALYVCRQGNISVEQVDQDCDPSSAIKSSTQAFLYEEPDNIRMLLLFDDEVESFKINSNDMDSINWSQAGVSNSRS